MLTREGYTDIKAEIKRMGFYTGGWSQVESVLSVTLGFIPYTTRL
jgi:hypothetical protein